MNAVATGSRAVLWAAGLALGLLLLSSLFRQPLTVPQGTAFAIFAGLALARPADAVLIFAALGPLVSVIGAVFQLSFGGSRMLETLALLLLVPWIAMQARRIRDAHWRSLDWALLGFAVIVVTSAAVHLPAVALRTGTDSTVRVIWRALTRTYLERPAGFEVVTDAVLLLEGLGLCAVVSRLAADSATARRIAGMVIAGATGAALLNVYRLFEVGLRGGSVTQAIAATFTTLRINTQFGDLNAAGSYFAMALVAAVGLADVRSRRGRTYCLAAVPLAAAVWLSGSRAALAGAALGILGTLAVCHKERGAVMIRLRKQLLTLTALAVALVAALILLSKTRNNTMRYSVFARVELTATAFRMLGDRPFLGVGVSRFYELFPEYASAELRKAFYEASLIPIIHENAHNNFLQILAELGLIGFAAFVLVLWLALRPDRLGADPAAIRPALVVAIGTLLFTALLGHPLLTPEVAYPFWIMLGLTAAGAPDLNVRSAAMLRVASSGMLVLLVVTIPIRAGYERRQTNLEGVALGMSNWERDESGNRFRWASSRSTLFIESRARVIRIPLRAALPATCAVEIRIDGRPVDRVTIPSDFWQDVRLRLPAPADTRRHYRIELIADESCAAGKPDSGRTLMVGRPDEVGVPLPPLPR